MFYDWNWRGADASLGRALELAPGSSSVIRLSGVLAGILGRPDDAIGMFRRALDQDPLSAAAYHSLGLALHVVDDLPDAEEAFRKALDLAPQRIGTHAHLALTILARGRPEEALAEATREAEDGYRLWALAIVHRARGDDASPQGDGCTQCDARSNKWPHALLYPTDWPGKRLRLRQPGGGATRLLTGSRALRTDRSAD